MQHLFSKRLTIIGLILLLGACQYVPPTREESPYYVVPVGSTLTLNEPVPIPSGRASVYIQGGMVLPFGGVRKYYPHCRLEMWTLTEQPRVVQPDRFRIKRVERNWRYVDRGERVYAGLSVDDNVGGLLIQINATEMFLESERQPDVYRLTCEQWAEGAEARYLTIREIRTALSGLITLQLAE